MAKLMFLVVASLICLSLFLDTDSIDAKDLVRPERVVSKRLVMYDRDTYTELAGLWAEYYQEFPSADAYANWMYAARYADLDGYEKLLEKGLRLYPASPVLLYLTGLKKHGAADNSVGRDYLERAVALDPTYVDPWFALVIHYMVQDDKERLNLALRNLLERGAVPDVVMDYSYNMLMHVDPSAILVCNGDNDTYPGLILTQLLDFRPDVAIVNRSLLNTDWYPQYMIEKGLPSFVTQDELFELRERILSDLKDNKQGIPPGGPFGDPLIERLITAATAAERPVYFSWTLMMTDTIERYMKNGRPLGLVNLVTPPKHSHQADLRKALDVWLQNYRTGGMDSWQLHYAKATDTTLGLTRNYAGVLFRMMDVISADAPNYRLPLFYWYQQHLVDLLPQNMRSGLAPMWCRMTDVPEITEWCREQGLAE
jgi:hypothetical protein